MDPQADETPRPGDQRLIRALGHPLRARLFEELGQRPLNLLELAAVLKVSPSKAAYHSQVLEDAGGVARDDEGGVLTLT